MTEPAEPKPGSRATIARRAGIVAAGTLSSRLLGAVRDAVIAAAFTITATDAFWLAFTIPNALRVLLGEGAVSGAFVPVLSDVREKKGEDAARIFYAKLAGAMLLVLTLVCAVGVTFAEPIVSLYADGFKEQPALYRDTVFVARIVFPYIGLMGIAALITGALHTYKRFVAPAFAPVMLNLCLIAAALFFVPLVRRMGWPAITALAIGAICGGALHVLTQLPSLRDAKLLVRPRLDLRDENVQRAFMLLGPLVIALGVYQLNILLSRRFASEIPGAVSYLYYGQRLVEIPQGLFALAIASAALPTLSDMKARGEEEEGKRIFREGLSMSLFVSIPSTIALMILAEPAIAVVFGHGEFAARSIEQTTRSLIWQASGIWAVASVRTIIPMFHAYGDTKTPVVASALNLVVFVALALSLMGPMEHEGLALAVTVGAVVQLAALLILLRMKAGPLGLSAIGGSVLKVCVASGVMGLMLSIAMKDQHFTDGDHASNAVRFGGAVFFGSLVFLVAARVMRVPELVTFMSAVKRKLRR